MALTRVQLQVEVRLRVGAARDTRHFGIYVLLQTVVFLWLLATYPLLFHWSTFALYCCSLVIGTELIPWIRNEYSIFDPKGLITLISLHTFVIAPIIVVATDYSSDPRMHPPDWRPWIGQAAAFSAIGLWIVFRLAKIDAPKKRSSRWTLSRTRGIPILFVAFGLGVFSQITVWRFSGGLTTIERAQNLGASYVFQMFGSLTPFVGLLIVTSLSRRDSNKSQTSAMIVVAVLSIASFFVDGLRGSRSSFIYSVFLLVGGVHFFWRPLPNRYFLYLLFPAFMFIYIYGFYKHYGSDFIKQYEQGYSIEELSMRSKRDLRHVLVGDMSRADVQAVLFWRHEQVDYDERMGGTYANSALAVLLPSSIFDYGKCMEKSVAGGELLYGTKSRSICPTRIYGLLGESMLNWGRLGILPMFFLFGLLMRFSRRFYLSLQEGDARLFLVPLIPIAMVSSLVNDFDNTLFLLVTKAAVPILLLTLVSDRVDEPSR